MPTSNSSLPITTKSLTALVATAALFAAPFASAQPALPDPSIQSISQAERSGIGGYTAHYINQLRNSDIDDVEIARAALLRPLNDPDISVPYRLAYTQALGEPLARFLANEQDSHRLANGLAVAGRLADRTSVQPIVTTLQSDELQAQIAAASALRSMLVELSLPNVTPVQRRPADDLFQAARQAIQETNDSELVEVLLSAVMGGRGEPRFSERGLTIILSAGKDRIARAINDVPELIDTTWPEAARVALGAIRSRIVTAPADEQFPTEFLRDAADLSALALSLAYATIDEAPNQVDEIERQLPLATLAENVASLAIARASRQSIAPPTIRPAFLDSIDDQNPDSAISAIDALLSPTGLIGSAPFDVDPDAYRR